MASGWCGVSDRWRYISADYLCQLRTMHESGVWGGGAERWVSKVAKRALKSGSKTVLDYGCGPGILKKLLPANLDVREYDPAVPEKSLLPIPADIVACIDVLEHIEPEFLEPVLNHIHSLTIKLCLVVISVRPADKRLPDGRNAHLIIDNGAWWVEQLRKLDWKIQLREANYMELSAWLIRKS